MLKNKTMATMIAFILILTITIPIVALQQNVSVEAQLAGEQPIAGPLPAGVTPDHTVSPSPALSVRPSVVGIGQLILINLWVTPAPHAQRNYRDFTLTIIPPDGKQEVIVMDSYVADGTAWLEWSPDQVGQWKFKFDFPGNYFPAGRYYLGDIVTEPPGSVYGSLYVRPASTPVTTITVQDEPVSSWPASPLPIDYWTRPVPYEHREWWPIAGNFPWHGPGGGQLWSELYPNTNPYPPGYSGGPGSPGWFGTPGYAFRQHFTPWVQGPTSPHVAWKQQRSHAGIIGGDYGVEIHNVDIFGNSLGYFPNIIYNGMAYEGIAKQGSGITVPARSYWRCYDIRTGELIWERPLEPGEVPPQVIEYFDEGLLPGGAVTGVHEHVTAVRLLSIGGGYLRKYHPWTGAMVTNVSITPMTGTGGTYYKNGYVLGVQNLGTAVPVEDRYRLIEWSTYGTSAAFATRVQSNITWPWSSLPDTTDYNARVSALVSGTMVSGSHNATRVRAACLDTGRELWDIWVDEYPYSGQCNIADHGKIAVLTERGYYLAYNLRTGSLAWKSESMEYPYDATSWGAYSVLSAYGLLYRNGYAGIYAFDWETGRIVWKYKALATYPFESPYVDENGQSVHPWNVGSTIAGGIYYAYNTEHSASVPIIRDWKLHAINATTGEPIWQVAISGASSKHFTDFGAVADGYLTLFSSDGYLYCFGKGQSETTVTAPQTAIQIGHNFIISGAVLDMSPAQPGTPAISDEYMSSWMEYLHRQMPKPSDAVGVAVLLTAIDPNGNFIEIGTATSDINGVFGFTWAPEVPGQYQITATFAGSESYGSSSASTFLAAIEAPVATTPETPPPQASVADVYFVPAVAGIIVAIIVGFALVLLMLRKRP